MFPLGLVGGSELGMSSTSVDWVEIWRSRRHIASEGRDRHLDLVHFLVDPIGSLKGTFMLMI